MTRSLKVRVMLAIGASGLGAPAALAGQMMPAKPAVPTFSGRYSRHDLKVKPSQIIFTADGSGFLAGPRRSRTRFDPLSWRSWTTTSARGSGFDWLNNCRPDCAGGTFHAYQVELKLRRAKAEGRHVVFTRMTVTFTGPRPPHVQRRTQVWKVVHHGRSYIWAFPNQ